MYEVIPSPGTEDVEFSSIEAKIELVLPLIKTLHVDISDGIFIPHKTFMDPKPFAKYKDELLLEVHFMTDNPIQYLKAFADAGFRRFIGQVEKMPDQAEFIAQGQLLGEVGLAIDGPTSLSGVKIPFDDLDCMLFYTGERAGHSGAIFMPDRLEKIKELRMLSSIPVEVDGGITDTTITQAKEAGVTRFVATSFIFNPSAGSGQVPSPKGQLQKLQEKV